MKLLLKEKGFSLVAAMVVAAIIAGIAVVVMNVSQRMNKMDDSNMVDFDEDDLESELKLILENKNNCRQSLLNQKFKKSEIHTPGTNAGLPIEIWLSNLAGTSRVAKKMKEGEAYRKIKIDTLRLFMNAGTASNFPEGLGAETGVVKLNFMKGQVKKEINIDVTVNYSTDGSGESTISGCSQTVTPQFCETVGLTYNTQMGQCNVATSCDDWLTIANPDGWTGERDGLCATNPNGYIERIRILQERDEGGDQDMNGFQIKCCYPPVLDAVECTAWHTVTNPDAWTGEVNGFCTNAPNGKLQGIQILQERDEGGDRDMNGFRIRCCYPKT